MAKTWQRVIYIVTASECWTHPPARISVHQSHFSSTANCSVVVLQARSGSTLAIEERINSICSSTSHAHPLHCFLPQRWQSDGQHDVHGVDWWQALVYELLHFAFSFVSCVNINVALRIKRIVCAQNKRTRIKASVKKVRKQ